MPDHGANQKQELFLQVCRIRTGWRMCKYCLEKKICHTTRTLSIFENRYKVNGKVGISRASLARVNCWLTLRLTLAIIRVVKMGCHPCRTCGPSTRLRTPYFPVGVKTRETFPSKTTLSCRPGCVRYGGAWECRQNWDASLITEGDPEPQAFSEVVYQPWAGRPARKLLRRRP